jgi:Cytochrome c3
MPKVPFHKTASVCFDCHNKVDHHKGKLGEHCEGCHSPTRWRQTKPFDHNKTKFQLEGAHKSVQCETCHVGEIYKDLAATCGSCHRLQDVHGDRYGPKCETCHDQVKWKNAHFEHDKTKFPLHGAHATVKCDACHTGNLYRDKLEMTCVSCHQKQDPHKGQLGPRCEQCHSDSNWRKDIKFNHNQTNFPLTGLHAPVPCAKCHQSLTYKDAPTACEKCHQDSRHQGRLGSAPRCGTCHTANGWARWHFDHGRQTKYPLTGAHAKLVCEACHSVRNASLNLPTACEKCHADFHKGHLGVTPKCETCHNTSVWAQWRFDHGRQANYPLIGAHAKLKCETCHMAINASSLKVASDCFSCHRKDDAHSGSFGRMCDRCHTPVSWNRVEIRN